MRPKTLLLTVAVVVLFAVTGCGGSSGRGAPMLAIRLDEVASRSIEARHRSPGIPCDHAPIPEESGVMYRGSLAVSPLNLFTCTFTISQIQSLPRTLLLRHGPQKGEAKST